MVGVRGFDFSKRVLDHNDASVEIVTFPSSNGKFGIILCVLRDINLHVSWSRPLGVTSKWNRFWMW